MAFGIVPTGFILKTFDDIRKEINDYERLNIDSSLLLTDDTDLGQINVAHSVQLAELWELAQAEYSSMDADTANQWALDQLASLTGTLRSGWTKTTVEGRVSLNPNTTLPAGSVANLAGQPDVRFETVVAVSTGAAAAILPVQFIAQTAGKIEVPIGELDTISIAVSGWTAVDNAVAGTPGTQPETDPVFRAKRLRELALRGSTNLDAIVAGVSAVAGVVHAQGLENTTPFAISFIAPHYISILTQGGTDKDVAEAIYREKAAGIGTAGSYSYDVTGTDGQTHTIRFSRSLPLPIYCTTTIQKNANWDPLTSPAEIKTLIMSYINNLNAGGDLIYDKLKATIYTNAGVDLVTILLVDTSSPPTAAVDITIPSAQYATIAEPDITVIAL